MRKVVFLLVALCLTGCTAATDTSSVEEEVRATLVAYSAAINAGDAAAAGAFYDDEGDFYWVERGRVQYKNADEARESMKNLADSDFDVTIMMTDVKVAPLSSSTAFASGLFETTFAQPDGKSFGLGGWMTVGMVKREDGWRIAGGHTEAVAVQDDLGK